MQKCILIKTWWKYFSLLEYKKKLIFSDGIVLLTSGYELYKIEDPRIVLRPIKSEREKFHDAALELYDDNAQVWLDAMFNAGFKAPN